MDSLDLTTENFIQKLKRLSTTLIWDRSYGHATMCGENLINYTIGLKIAGPVFIVETSGEIMPVLEALNQIPPHHILFINDLSDKNQALLGDIISESAMYQKLAGIVVFGRIRDVEVISGMTIPVWAKGASIAAAALGTPIRSFPKATSVDGITINKGDWILGDANGMVAINADKLRLVIKSAEVKNRKENACLQRIRAGEMIAEQMNLTAFLDRKGELIIDF